MAKLHIGCGPHVVEGWVNIDKSPSALLSRAPALRRALSAARVLTPPQAAGFPPGVVRADVSRRIPADSASVDFVYSAHMIEHLSRWQGLAFVRECRRVLRPGGIVRLATPDLGLLVNDYTTRQSPLLAEHGTPGDAFCAEYNAYADPEGNMIKKLIKKTLGGDSHQWLYDMESIALLLSEGGFAEVKRRAYREGAMPDLNIIEQRERSLFVEAW